MAQLPQFVFSPNTLLSVIGIIKGPDTTTPTPAGDWRDAVVDVVIPAFNEEHNIVRCLASVVRQTRRPRHIVVVDDGSADATAARARAFGGFHGVDVTVIRREVSIGKTPTVKQQARSLDSDVVFVLDADSVLESDNYLERTVHDLYQAAGVASACGMVLPLRQRDREAADQAAEVRAFVEAFPAHHTAGARGWLRRLAAGVTNAYREVLYLVLQRLVYRGQMAMFGTLCNPVGCAVAYRREYLKALFDSVEPTLGDDLTNSEDIFIGFSMLNEGYRNIQVTDVLARTVEPEAQRLPRQMYLWSSAFLQSAFYFDALLRSPFKALRRRTRQRQGRGPGGRFERAATPVRSLAFAGAGTTPPNALLAVATDLMTTLPAAWRRHANVEPAAAQPSGERRRIQEPYRQPFGAAHTQRLGRPVGWTVLLSAVEKVSLPTVLLVMILLRNWEGLAITLGAETLMTAVALALVMKGRRLEFVLKTFAVTPVRYGLLVADLVTMGRFAVDLWITRNRSWRK